MTKLLVRDSVAHPTLADYHVTYPAHPDDTADRFARYEQFVADNPPPGPFEDAVLLVNWQFRMRAALGLSPSAERYHVLTDTLRGLLQLVEASRRLHDAVSARAATSTPTEHQTWEVFQAHAGVGEALDGITPLPEPLLWLKHEQEGSL